MTAASCHTCSAFGGSSRSSFLPECLDALIHLTVPLLHSRLVPLQLGNVIHLGKDDLMIWLMADVHRHPQIEPH